MAQAIPTDHQILKSKGQEPLDWRPYVFKSNVENPEEARVIVFLELHNDDRIRFFNWHLIELWYQKKDFIWIEVFSDAKEADLRQKISPYTEKINNESISIGGWKPADLKMKKIVIEGRPAEKIEDIIRKILPPIAYIDPYIEIHDHLTEEGKKILSLVDRAVFDDMQNSLIRSIDSWLIDNKGSSSKLFVSMGRNHGNPQSKMDPSRRESAQRLLSALEKTCFIIIDYLPEKL